MTTRREHQTDVNVHAAEDKEKRLAKTDDPGKGTEGIAPNLESRVVVGATAFQQHAVTSRGA